MQKTGIVISSKREIRRCTLTFFFVLSFHVLRHGLRLEFGRYVFLCMLKVKGLCHFRHSPVVTTC